MVVAEKRRSKVSRIRRRSSCGRRSIPSSASRIEWTMIARDAVLENFGHGAAVPRDRRACRTPWPRSSPGRRAPASRSETAEPRRCRETRLEFIPDFPYELDERILLDQRFYDRLGNKRYRRRRPSPRSSAACRAYRKLDCEVRSLLRREPPQKGQVRCPADAPGRRYWFSGTPCPTVASQLAVAQRLALGREMDTRPKPATAA